MSVSYDVFVNAFLNKVTEFEFLQMDDYSKDSLVNSYMKRSCAQFDKICKYDIMKFDDLIRQIDVDIPEDEIDEIADIVSEGMLVHWMKPYVYHQDNLLNVLNTKDFTTYSPAQVLMRARGAYDAVKKDFTNMMREYSYVHGDLTELHL